MLKPLALRWLAGASRTSAAIRFQVACCATRLFSRQKPIKLLLISDGAIYTSEQQFAPFKRFSKRLRKQLGIVTRYLSVDRAVKSLAMAWTHYDIIGLKFSFRADEATAMALSRRIRNAIDGTATRLVYFDGDDDLNILWPELVQIIDLYVKKHVYRDHTEYQIERQGKSNLTDWVAREHGISFETNEIPLSRSLPVLLNDRVWPGWSIGLDDKIADLARRMPFPSADQRPIDVCSRAFVSDKVWIYPLRGQVVQQLEQMSESMHVLVPRERVSQDQYYEEMRASKICVSPFGYGEICWRDFEAILLGCLLVKPDMGHIETAPDIFISGVTYAPVKWDYSDLRDVCAHYLDHDDQRQKIVEQAYATVIESQDANWFINRLGLLMSRL